MELNSQTIEELRKKLKEEGYEPDIQPPVRIKAHEHELNRTYHHGVNPDGTPYKSCYVTKMVTYHLIEPKFGYVGTTSQLEYVMLDCHDSDLHQDHSYLDSFEDDEYCPCLTFQHRFTHQHCLDFGNEREKVGENDKDGKEQHPPVKEGASSGQNKTSKPTII